MQWKVEGADSQTGQDQLIVVQASSKGDVGNPKYLTALRETAPDSGNFVLMPIRRRKLHRRRDSTDHEG
jgi:hypothetical protein